MVEIVFFLIVLKGCGLLPEKHNNYDISYLINNKPSKNGFSNKILFPLTSPAIRGIEVFFIMASNSTTALTSLLSIAQNTVITSKISLSKGISTSGIFNINEFIKATNFRISRMLIYFSNSKYFEGSFEVFSKDTYLNELHSISRKFFGLSSDLFEKFLHLHSYFIISDNRCGDSMYIDEDSLEKT